MNCASVRGRLGRRRSFLEGVTSALLQVFDQEATADALARADGLLQMIDPRVKIVGSLLLILATVASRFLWLMGVVFLVAIALGLLSRIPLRLLTRRVWIGVLLFTTMIALPAIFLTPGESRLTLPLLHWQITDQGLRSAAFLFARAETAATLAVLVALTTPWSHLLKALRVLRLPAVAVTLLGMTHRYAFLLLRSVNEFFEARRSRCLNSLSGRIGRKLATASAGVLFEKTLTLSADVYSAMQARGFTGEILLLDDFAMRALDWWALAAFVFIGGGVLWLGN